MGINFEYINVPANSVDADLFFNETRIVEEKCNCGSGFFPGKWQHHSEIFTDDFRIWLESFGCEILKAEGFRVYPNTALAWHNDTNDDTSATDLDLNLTTKINFMWGNLTNCYMEYGETIDPIIGRKSIINKRGRTAYVYNPALMKVTERFSLENTILINRGTVHRVSNESDQDWLCLSCIIKNKSTGKPLLYEDAVKIFSSVCML